MKKLLLALAAFLLLVTPAYATTLFPTGGGTGSTTLSGILLGNGVSPVNTLTVGSGLLLTGTTLSATGGSSASSTLLSDSNTWSGLNTFIQTIVGSITGNAGTATLLQTGRTINGVSFNGGSNITIFAASSTLLGDSNTFSGTDKFSNSPIFSTLGAGTVNSTVAGTIYNTATSTPSVTAPIGYSGTLGQFIGGISGNFTCTTASAGVTGCLSGTDYNTFSGKENALTFTTPLIRTGNTINWVGLATTTQPGSSNVLVSNGTAGVYGAATTTATCTGNATCTAFTVLGATPVTINVAAGTAASSTLLSDSNTFSGAANKFTNPITIGTLNGLVGANNGLTYAVSTSSFATFAWPFTPINATSVSTSSGLVVTASSTIGNGTFGLTVSGNSTTTGVAYHVGNVGIGVVAPNSLLTVSRQPTIQTPVSGSTAQFVGVDGAPLRITFDTNNSANTSGTALMFRNSGGTAATPAATLTGAVLGSLNFRGYGTTAYAAGSTGLMTAKAEAGFTDTSMPTAITFDTTPTNSVTAVEHFRVSGNGNIGVGSTSPFAKMSIHANPTDSVIDQVLFAIGSSTATATTTLFNVLNNGSVGIDTVPTGARLEIQGTTTDATGNGIIVWDSNGKNVFTVANNGSTTIGSFGACNTTNALTTDAAGRITCGAISGSGGSAFPFTPTTAFGSAANATGTLIGFTAGLYSLASSTIGGGGTQNGLTINGGATTTGNNKILGNLTVVGTATTTIAGTVRNTGRITMTGSGTTIPYVPTGGGDPSYFIINRSSAAQDGSLLYYTNGTCNWEIGMPGDSDMHWKSCTGADGSSVFTDRLFMSAITGAVGYGTSVPTGAMEVATSAPTGLAQLTVTNKNAGAGSVGSALALFAQTPGYAYYVRTDAGANGGKNLTINDGSFCQGIYVDSSNNVGIQDACSNSAGAALTVNGKTAVASGTAALPTIAFINDLATGIYQAVTGTLSFVTAGVEKARILANGNFGIGTTTPQWVVNIASSTKAQLALTSNSTGGNFHWTVNNIFGNLFFATSSAGTFATSTFANPNVGYIEFPNNGGCVGCTDIVLTGGINLRNGKYVNATTTSLTAYTQQDVYTVPAGRRAVLIDMNMYNNTALSVSFNPYVKIAGSYYRLSNSTSTASSKSNAQPTTPFIAEAGESFAIRSDTTSANTPTYVNVIEYDASVPVFTKRAIDPTTATTTIYTVPSGVSSFVLPASGSFLTSGASSVGIFNNTSASVNEKVCILKSDQTTAVDGTNCVQSGAGTAAAGLTTLTLYNGGVAAYMNSGDSLQFALGTSLSGTGSLVYMNVVEH